MQLTKYQVSNLVKRVRLWM